MALLEVNYAEKNVTQSLLPVAEDLAAGRTKEFGPIPHANGVKADLDVELRVRFRWEHGPESAAKAERRITAAPHLNVNIPTPTAVHPNAPWKFSLTLRNTSDEDVTITAIEQTLTDGGLPPVAPEPVTGLPPDPIHPKRRFTISNVPGIVVTTAIPSVYLEISVVYKWGGRTWSPPPTRKKIDVT